jgi:putative membrane protein
MLNNKTHINFRLITLTFALIFGTIFLNGCGLIYGPHSPHMGPGMWENWGSGPFGMIFTLIFWGLVIWGLVSIIRGIFRPQSNRSQNPKAIDILKERYAKGEIDQSEFEAKKKDLMT